MVQNLSKVEPGWNCLLGSTKKYGLQEKKKNESQHLIEFTFAHPLEAHVFH